ncbi:adenylyl cyclase class-3/4/guanylyl cyclase [Thioploca ingrica]|uniref:Adenylyl cyclase class-3/4/guanylyl cyclase n=1 Tax=Thioploca ingrica TaxID=40754 RepID=A0A090AFS7_9GAMM|nr:adenylyl cyclase class-3/4/guanylyl cyclase [Thioploca ingrica]
MFLDLIQLLLREQKIGYAIVDFQLTVLAYEGQLSLFNNHEGTKKLHLLDLVPELIGCEDLLQEILQGELPRFELENLNRTDSANNIHYITVAILRYIWENTEQPILLVTLTDTSEWVKIQQMLTQQRNEVSLLKQNLADTNQRLEFILQRYVPKEVGVALMEKRILPELGGAAREVSVLFADLRNYTSISEKQTPKETIDMLNICMDIASTAIAEAGGVIVNYMGDGIMAIFNAPDKQPNHAQRAVKAGLTLQKIAKLYQQHEKIEKYPPFHFGVGINTGVALVGNIGAQWHYQYSAVGDTVNVASRICSHAKPGEVLIGANTYSQVKNSVFAKALPATQFKGKSEALVTYQVIELFEDNLQLKLGNSN